jgi:hypothetical protein
MGQPDDNSQNPDRHLARCLVDEDYEIAQTIRSGDTKDRVNRECAEEPEVHVANALHTVDHDLLKCYPKLDDLVNYILRKCPYNKFPKSTCNFSAKALLLFGASNLYEAIQTGLQQHPHFHFNFCTTTRSDSQGEWHAYLTGGGRNNIFSYADCEAGTTNLRVTDVLHSGKYDLQFIPIFQYVGSKNNGFDDLCLAVESMCQGVYHN